VTPLKRIVHEATFAKTSWLRLLALPRPDVYLVVSPPLVLGAAAWALSFLKRAPFVFHVQDLQPDAAMGLGMLREGWFTRALFWLESFAYRKARIVSGISPEIVAAFRRKGVPESKLLLYPNSIEPPDIAGLPARGQFRRKHGFGDEFLAVYAGNLGVKQGLGILLDASRLVGAERRIRIILCGEGAEREALERRIADENLRGVTMLPLQHGRDYEELLVDADISFITQQSGSGNSFFPSKLLVTLAYFCPVITVADPGSALADAVNEGAFGINIPPGEVGRIAVALSELDNDRGRLKMWGEGGRRYVERFERNRVIAPFVDKLRELAQNPKGASAQ
jgi:colanic acid biosynthesis glycosyl transferase WcaI